MNEQQTQRRAMAPHIKPNKRLNPRSDTAISPKRSVRLPDVMDAELEERAQATGVTVSKLIREAVGSYLTETRAQKAS